MTTTVYNRLNGSDGTGVSDATLAATSEVGTVTWTDTSGALTYDTARTVHGLPTIRVDTGHAQGTTPRLLADLPAAPWWMRWYVWLPELRQGSVYGADEVRWVAGVGDTARGGDLGLVLHEDSGGDVALRLQSSDLASTPVVPSMSGTPVPVGQWVRIELHSDGTQTVCRLYPGHGTTDPRTATWSDTAMTGPRIQLGAYRYPRDTLLQVDDNDPNEVWSGSRWSSGDTPVADLQNRLMNLGYDLPQYEDDGWYGQEVVDAVYAFQGDYSYDLVDGEAGPSTMAGVELATRLEVDMAGYPPASWLSHLAVSDSAWIGPASAPPTSSPARLVLGSPL